MRTACFHKLRASALEMWIFLPRFYSGAAAVDGNTSGRRCVRRLSRKLEALFMTVCVLKMCIKIRKGIGQRASLPLHAATVVSIVPQPEGNSCWGHRCCIAPLFFFSRFGRAACLAFVVAPTGMRLECARRL